MSNSRASRRCKQKALQNCSKFFKKSDDSHSLKIAQDCVICLDVVVLRGVLSVCDHWFCFECIFEWAKSTNTCPLCKLRFRVITKVSCVDTPWGFTKQIYRIKDKNQSNMAIPEDDYEMALGLVNEETSFDEDDHDADETFYPSSGQARTRSLSSRNALQLRRRNANSRLRTLRQAQITNQSSSSLSSQASNTPVTSISISVAVESLPNCVSQVSNANSSVYSDTSEDEISETQQAKIKKRKKRLRIVYQSPKRKKSATKSANSVGWIDMSFKCTTKSRSSPDASPDASEEYFSSSSEFENNIVEECFSNDQSTRVNSKDILSDSPIIRSNRLRSRNSHRIDDDTIPDESPINAQIFLKKSNSVNNHFLSLTESFSVDDIFNENNHMSPCIISQQKKRQLNNFEKENLDISDCLQSSTVDAKCTLSCSPLLAHCNFTPLRDINNIVQPTPQKIFKCKSLVK